MQIPDRILTVTFWISPTSSATHLVQLTAEQHTDPGKMYHCVAADPGDPRRAGHHVADRRKVSVTCKVEVAGLKKIYQCDFATETISLEEKRKSKEVKMPADERTEFYSNYSVLTNTGSVSTPAYHAKEKEEITDEILVVFGT